MTLTPEAAADLQEWLALEKTAKLYHDYFEGRHRLGKWATQKFRKKYLWALNSSTTNYCPAVVSAFTDDIEIVEWNVDASQSLKDNLDRELARVNDEAWSTGDGFVIVWPNARTGEHQALFQRSGTVVPTVDEYDPTRLERASKVWRDREGFYHMQTFHEDRVETFVSLTKANRQQDVLEPSNWVQDDVFAHDYGAVPVCWFKRGAAGPFEPGVSILRDVIPIQDRLNKNVADEIVTGEAISDPLRYLLLEERGSAEYTLDEANRVQPPKVQFDGNRDTLLLAAAREAGQFEGPNAEALLKIHELAQQDIASVVGLTPWYMSATAPVNISNETAWRLEKRLFARQKAYVRDNRPVYRGLLELLGLEGDLTFYTDIPRVEPAPKPE